MSLYYYKDMFKVENLEEAKNIILTEEVQGGDYRQRWERDRGANGYIEGMNSAIGRIGFVMGQKITGDSDIYLKADLLHEFAGERDLQLTSDAGGTNDILTKHNDYGDTWFELGLGANIKVSKTASVYGEIERGFGGDINKKWSVNGGVRFTF